MKWRLFRSRLHGGDPDAERVYRWHIEARSGARLSAGLATDRWKRTIDDYVVSAGTLFASMFVDGFDPKQAIPLDPNGELLDGSHRLACALALGIEAVPVTHSSRLAWAPAWGEAWFVEKGMAAEDLARLRADYAALAS